jgi:mannan endo-1,4-beta-mannosidase
MIKKTLTYYLLFIIVIACKKPKNEAAQTPDFSAKYSIYQNKIYNYSNAKQFIGANALHSFSAGSSDMALWNMDIAREFIGNVKENPVTGFPIQDANGSYLHSLQAIVDSNRLQNRITIFCPFGWDGTAANMCTGKRPTQTSFYIDCKIKLQQWATQFKNQPDVWLELWNEPYRYDRADGYTDAIWLNDMNDMYNNIRNTGNNNIVLVPCAEQGQDESVIISNGATFIANKKNVLFDIHAYEKWLLVSNANMGARLQQLQQNKLPIFFGEVAPINAGVLMNPQSFLDSIYNRGISVCAWVWKYASTDQDALLSNNGQPNNNNNNNWGSAYKALAVRVRRP